MRKTQSLLASVAILAGSQALAKVEVSETGRETVYEFSLEDVQFSDVSVEDQAFVKAAIKGAEGFEAVHWVEGEPEVPVVRFYVDGAGKVAVDLGTDDTRRSFVRTKPALPAIRSAAKIEGARRHLTVSKAAYRDARQQPARDFDVQTIGTIRGVPRQMVTVYPVKYQAAQNTWATKRKFRVTFTRDAVQPAAHRGDGKLIALVVGEQFEQSAALDSFRALKKSQGYDTVTMISRKSATKPEEIRSWLRDVYRKEAELRYAILIGDSQDVPAKESDEIAGVTDHFYRSLDTDDYEADIATPDIGVGRIAVSTEADLQTVVDKTAKYERNDFRDKSWQSRIAWIATDDTYHYDVAEGSFDYVIDNYTRGQAWGGSFPGQNQSGGDQLYAIKHKATTHDVVQRLNEGRGLVNYGGHGSTEFWAGPEFTASDVNAMSHDEALPVVWANACITGMFTEDSFAETWLKARRGGVIYWGSMDSTYWDEDDILQRYVYDLVFRDKVTEFAAYTEQGLAEVWRHYGGANRSKYYFETYVNFGDPTLSMHLPL